jgi:hypothetical protein
MKLEDLQELYIHPMRNKEWPANIDKDIPSAE